MNGNTSNIGDIDNTGNTRHLDKTDITSNIVYVGNSSIMVLPVTPVHW